MELSRRSTYPILVLGLLVACGGEPRADDRTADTAAAAFPADSRDALEHAAADSAAMSASTPVLPPPGGMAAPITGRIFEVRMIGDARGFRFEPAHVRAKPGDGVKFVVESGGPHEVTFDLDAVPQSTKLQLLVNMPNSASGRSPLLAAPREAWTVSLGGLAPGTYPFVSTPRLPQGMKGEIEIVR